MADLAATADDAGLGETASKASTWSGLLWEGNANGPAVYDELRATMARLHQIRANLILNRPIGDSGT